MGETGDMGEISYLYACPLILCIIQILYKTQIVVTFFRNFFYCFSTENQENNQKCKLFYLSELKISEATFL
jgi:ATP sulfurylase